MSHQGDIGTLLKALVEHGPSLRAAGFSSVTLPDGTSFTLRAAASGPAADAAALLPPDEDDADPIAAEQREERELRAKWETQWTRITASSGAPVPPFPGVTVAKRSMPTLFGARAA